MFFVVVVETGDVYFVFFVQCSQLYIDHSANLFKSSSDHLFFNKSNHDVLMFLKAGVEIVKL